MTHKAKIVQMSPGIEKFILINYFTKRGHLTEYTENNSSRKIGDCNTSISAGLALLFSGHVEDTTRREPCTHTHRNNISILHLLFSGLIFDKVNLRPRMAKLKYS
jgi:hypothetical protein